MGYAKASGRVLLIDDDAAICRDYGRLLRGFKLVVETASNGRQAIERLTPDRFDVVVAEIAMPNMSGVDVLRSIRERDPHLPVILMTAAPCVETAVKAVELGATQYLIKPVDPDVLGEAIWRAVDLRDSATRLRAAPVVGIPEARPDTGLAALDARFDGALEFSWLAFQPIVQVSDRSVYGYEALVRSGESRPDSPLDLFDAAGRLGRTFELGRTIRRKVAEATASAASDALLFVDVHGEELSDNELLSNVAPLSGLADRVVLEITQRSGLHNVSGLWTRLSRLRKLGYRIAVDDLGAGYAGLCSVSELEPEFVKLDRALVRGVSLSPRKQSLLKGITQACSRDLGMLMVCEGIEHPDESDALARLGIDLQQGSLFATPAQGSPTPGLLLPGSRVF